MKSPNDVSPILTVVMPVTSAGNDASAIRDEPETFQGVINAAIGAAEAKPAPPQFRLLTDDDLISMPPLEWLVKGVLPAEGLGAIYGSSGSGKSFLALELAAAVAHGMEFFGRKTKARPVTYLALEGAQGFRQRVMAWRGKRERGTEIRFITDRFDLRDSTAVDALGNLIIEAGRNDGLLIIDTLFRAAPGFDENSPVDMGEAVAAATRIQEKVGGLVLLVHHTGKDVGKGLRGHSSLLAALDAAVEVSRNGDARSWRVAKSKDSGDETEHAFKLEVSEVDRDEDEEPVTSCTVTPVEQWSPVGHSKTDGARKQFETAWRASRQEVRDGAPYLSRECWTSFFTNNGLSERTARNKLDVSRAGETVNLLTSAGHLAPHPGGWILTEPAAASALLIGRDKSETDVAPICPSSAPRGPEGQALQGEGVVPLPAPPLYKREGRGATAAECTGDGGSEGVPLKAPRRRGRKAGPTKVDKITARERLFLKAVHAALDERPAAVSTAEHIKAGAKMDQYVVTGEAVRRRFYALLGDEVTQPRHAFSRAREGLLGKNLIGACGETLWLAG